MVRFNRTYFWGTPSPSIIKNTDKGDENYPVERFRSVNTPSREIFGDWSVIIVGFTGLAGSGKTTAAQVLEDQKGYVRLSFAGPLKAMARAFGLTAREMAGDLKETPSQELCGKSPRQFMQMLGTEFGRNLIGADIWVNAFKRQVDELRLEDVYGIVVDDVRFENEVAAIREMGGVLVQIERSGAGSKTGASHVSEKLNVEPDFIIKNNGSLFDLESKLIDLGILG